MAEKIEDVFVIKGRGLVVVSQNQHARVGDEVTLRAMVRGVEKSDAHPSVGLNLGRLTLESFKAASPGDLAADTSGFFDGAPIDFRTFQRLNSERVDSFGMKLGDWSPMEWGCELGEELGELLGAIKRRARAPHPTVAGWDITGKPKLPLEAVGAEIADVVIVAALIASRLGIDLNSAIREKWNRSSEKVGFAGRL